MKAYVCLTHDGLRELDENEIYQIAQPIIWNALHRSYRSYYSDHEDLAQEAALELFKAMERYDPERGEIYPYIKAIVCRRICWEAAKLRKQSEHTVALTEALEAVLPAVPSVIETYTEDFDDMLQQLKQTLTREEQQAVDLKLEGVSNTEIYNTLHPETLKTRIGQAMTAVWAAVAQKYLQIGGEASALR